MFEHQEYNEVQKFKLASHKFRGRGSTDLWWNDLIEFWQMYSEEEVRSWKVIKRLMHKHFIPDFYRQKFYNRLQRLEQCDLYIREHAREFKMLVMGSDLRKSKG